MIKSDLLIVCKTDLAPLVGANLDVMRSDSEVFRGSKPFFFTNLKTDEGLDNIIDWISREILLSDLA